MEFDLEGQHAARAYNLLASLMVDGANAEVAFEVPERFLDLDELEVALPEPVSAEIASRQAARRASASRQFGGPMPMPMPGTMPVLPDPLRPALGFRSVRQRTGLPRPAVLNPLHYGATVTTL